MVDQRRLQNVAVWSLVFLLSLWGMALVANAQTGQATISGTVTDQNGAVLVGGQVVATNTGTGLQKPTTAGADGTYVIPNLPVGTYSITVSQPGFRTAVRSGIVLTTDQSVGVNFGLQVGSTSESVTVSAGAELAEPTGVTISQVVNARAITELPLNGREPSALVNIAPGAVSALQTTAFFFENACCSWPVPTGSSVNGGRQSTTLYLLDGGINMDAYTYVPAPFPNADATQEFRVATNNYDIRYGDASSAVVNIVTKSGANTWHGNLFEFVRNQAFNAADYYSGEVDPLKRNQFGGSAGGRIIKDKLFVFGNIQRTIERQSQTGQTNFVPTNAELNGDFSAIPTQLVDADTGLPYPGNFIDPSNFNPVALKIEESIPKSASPDGLVLLPPIPLNRSFTEFTIRGDYYPAPRHQISLRSFVDKFSEPGFDGGGNLIASHASLDTRYQIHTLSWTWSPKVNFTNNLVLSGNQMLVKSLGDQIGADGQPVCFPCYGMNITDYPQYPPAIILMYVGGNFTVVGNSNVVPRWMGQVSDSASWVKGKHLIVAGVDVVRQEMEEGTDWLARPIVGFTGQVSGNAMADFLLGRAAAFQQGAGEATLPHENLYGLYVGDTYRMKPNFSINFGVRWEPYFPPTVAHGRMTLFRPGMQSTRYPNAPLGLVFPGDKGVPGGGYRSEPWNFQPRVGLTWQPKRLPNTSIRAGFGIFTNPNDLNDYPHSADGAPFAPTFQLSPGPDIGPYIDISDPFKNFAGTGGVSPFPPFGSPSTVPPSTVAFATPVTIQDNFETNLTLPKTQAWNFSVEHQFLKDLLVQVAYVGRESYHLWSPFELNPGFYSAGGARLRYPDFGTIQSNVSWSTASYHGLQIIVEKRFSHGLQLNSSYTHSKAIDDTSVATYGSIGGDPFNLKWNRGLSDLNFPNIWSTQWVYQTPSLAGHGRALAAVLGNWQISGVWQLTSGTPFSIGGGFGNNNSLAQVGGDRADLTGQPLQVHSGPKSHWLAQYFNPDAFVTNAPGTFGNSARNLLAGPGKNNADLALSKDILFKDRYKFQLRWEMYNAFNRIAFGLPATDPSAPGFGGIFSAGPARVMQLGGKLDW